MTQAEIKSGNDSLLPLILFYIGLPFLVLAKAKDKIGVHEALVIGVALPLGFGIYRFFAHRHKPKAADESLEGLLVNLAFSFILPLTILNNYSSGDDLGPKQALILALAFPGGYGLMDLLREKKLNFISALGFVSILISGGLALMQSDLIWFAVKEAAIPAMIGILVVGSNFTKKPLVKTFIYSPKILNIEVIESTLSERGSTEAFQKRLNLTTWILASSFLLSAILNFVLAFVILKSPPGTKEFNEEFANMTALSYPVIVIPSMVVTMLALWVLISGIKNLTGLDLEAIMNQEARKS